MNIFFQQKETETLIPGIAGQIELRVHGVSSPKGLVIICHPHPLYGGSLDNKVVTTIARTCRDQGYAALRFNFRGVGQSEGIHDEGRGERDDLATVIHWVRQQTALPIALAGFSFGGAIVAAYARDHAEILDWVMLVSPAVGRYGFVVEDAIHCPVLIVQGEQDEVLPPDVVYQWVGQHNLPSWQLKRLADTGHFYHGKLVELKEILVGFLHARDCGEAK